MTSTRERLAWALVFSVPVGVGVALATARMARAPPGDPLVLGSGAVTAAALFALMVVATGVNPDDSTS